MGILSRKKEVRSSSDPADQAIDAPAQSEGVAPESVDIPAVETVPSQPDAAPDLPVEPVEDELARVERSAEEEETEIRLKASELLGPIRQDPPDQRHEKSGSEPGTDLAEVISLANQKGGVAKTTSTLNLAVALAEMGNRVLCIDLDPPARGGKEKD
jgi:Mrp family chromosome partitioning ATPase